MLCERSIPPSAGSPEASWKRARQRCVGASLPPGYAHCGQVEPPWISSKLSTMGVTRRRRPCPGTCGAPGRRRHAVTFLWTAAYRSSTASSRRGAPSVGILCTAGSGASSPSPVVRPAPLRWFSPTERKTGEPWTNNRRRAPAAGRSPASGSPPLPC
jgi:hypothetical protein